MTDGYKLMWELSRHAVETPRCHWISTPEGDQGHEWCPRCGYYKVRNLKRHDRGRRADYFLDGGWRTSHDSMPMCAGCGVLLDGALTSCGARQELDYYEENGLSTNRAVDALYLSEILSEIPDDQTAVALAQQLLQAIAPLAVTAQPADGGK